MSWDKLLKHEAINEMEVIMEMSDFSRRLKQFVNNNGDKNDTEWIGIKLDGIWEVVYSIESLSVMNRQFLL